MTEPDVVQKLPTTLEAVFREALARIPHRKTRRVEAAWRRYCKLSICQYYLEK